MSVTYLNYFNKAFQNNRKYTNDENHKNFPIKESKIDCISRYFE